MTTQEVWDHHVEGFVARSVPKVLEDYSENSVLIVNGETLRGANAIRDFYSGLFVELPRDCAFDLTRCIVMDKNVFIMWNAESETVHYEFATDTFTIEDGKISLQTVAFVKRDK